MTPYLCPPEVRAPPRRGGSSLLLHVTAAGGAAAPPAAQKTQPPRAAVFYHRCQSPDKRPSASFPPASARSNEQPAYLTPPVAKPTTVPRQVGTSRERHSPMPVGRHRHRAGNSQEHKSRRPSRLLGATVTVLEGAHSGAKWGGRGGGKHPIERRGVRAGEAAQAEWPPRSARAGGGARCGTLAAHPRAARGLRGSAARSDALAAGPCFSGWGAAPRGPRARRRRGGLSRGEAGGAAARLTPGPPSLCAQPQRLALRDGCGARGSGGPVRDGPGRPASPAVGPRPSLREIRCESRSGFRPHRELNPLRFR